MTRPTCRIPNSARDQLWSRACERSSFQSGFFRISAGVLLAHALMIFFTRTENLKLGAASLRIRRLHVRVGVFTALLAQLSLDDVLKKLKSLNISTVEL